MITKKEYQTIFNKGRMAEKKRVLEILRGLSNQIRSRGKLR